MLALAVACFGSVLVLTNQQLVSGRMISTRDWERYVDYSLVVIGAAILGATWLRDPCWSRPAVVLTRESPTGRANERWNEVLVTETTVGRAQPLMNVHALLQTPVTGTPAPAAGLAGCD